MDRKPSPSVVWNRLGPAEKTAILETALEQPDLSPRKLACHLTDHATFTVSEATVYRVLTQYGLNRTISLAGFPASKEFRVKTTASNQMWAVRCQLLLCGGLGLVLLNRGARRLLALRVGQRSEAGHHRRFHQRCGGTSGGLSRACGKCLWRTHEVAQ